MDGVVKMSLNSLEDVYYLAREKLINAQGNINIVIAGIPKNSKSNDIIGNCVQEWIPQWLEDNGLDLIANSGTQVFPDFIATIDGQKYDMEVKCWNYINNPAFDIANFDGFYREIYENPRKLDAKYLIFGYTPTKHGFEISEIYLKNIWDITYPPKRSKYPIGLQVKQGRPYAIRPSSFHKNPENRFTSIKEFVTAIRDTRKMFPLENMIDPDEWYEKVSSGFIYGS